MELSIVTPVSRPQNLPSIYNSIVEAFKPFPDWNAVWFVVFDAMYPDESIDLSDCENVKVRKLATPSSVCGMVLSASGNMQRNMALDRIQGGLVYFLDDDTVLHPNLLTHIAPKYAEHPGINVVVDQTDKNGTPRLSADPSNVRLGGIDAGQVVLQRSLIGDCRWPPLDYEADAYFIINNYERDSGSFVFINVGVSLYNYLR